MKLFIPLSSCMKAFGCYTGGVRYSYVSLLYELLNLKSYKQYYFIHAFRSGPH